MKLTANAVKALTCDKADAIFFDDELKGFGYRVRVGAGGKVLRSWIVQYRHGLGHRRMTVGSAVALTAEQARGKAKKLLAKVALGDDPQGDRRGRRDKDRLTLRFVIDEFLAAKTAKLRPTTLREIRRYFTGPYFRKLHGMPIDRVSRRDVALCLSAIEREHGPIVRAVARAKANSLFVWAMRQGVTEHNPVIGTEPPERSAPRERVLSDAELADIWRACGDDDHGRIVRLLILLGARRAEIGGMRWSEINLGAGTWTLPKERSKNKREHTLPLPATALAIIRSVPMRATRDCLFGQRSGAGFNRSIRGSESNDEDMTAYVNAADAIRTAFECAVIIVHHCGIDGTRPRGHTSLTGTCAAQLATKRDAANNIVVTVEWMKDGPDGDVIASALKVETVGKDEDGEDITSCVVVPTDAQTSKRDIPKSARTAFKLLEKAIEETDEPAPTSNHIPRGTRTSSICLWRSYCYAGMVAESDKPDSKQKAFVRASQTLQNAGVIGIWGDYVWITGQAGQARTTDNLSG